jgi:hypothetical protein
MITYGHRGLGQDLTTDITDVLPDAYSDTSTITGLPVIWELGLFGIGALLLWSVGQKAVGATKKAIRKAKRRL